MVTLSRESSAISVLWSINELLRNKYLLNHQVSLLKEVIPTLFDNSNYNVERRTLNELANVSLLRAEVVKLAKTLNDVSSHSELERVISEALVDPLPEKSDLRHFSRTTSVKRDSFASRGVSSHLWLTNSCPSPIQPDLS